MKYFKLHLYLFLLCWRGDGGALRISAPLNFTDLLKSRHGKDKLSYWKIHYPTQLMKRIDRPSDKSDIDVKTAKVKKDGSRMWALKVGVDTTSRKFPSFKRIKESIDSIQNLDLDQNNGRTHPMLSRQKFMNMEGGHQSLSRRTTSYPLGFFKFLYYGNINERILPVRHKQRTLQRKSLVEYYDYENGVHSHFMINEGKTRAKTFMSKYIRSKIFSSKRHAPFPKTIRLLKRNITIKEIDKLKGYDFSLPTKASEIGFSSALPTMTLPPHRHERFDKQDNYTAKMPRDKSLFFSFDTLKSVLKEDLNIPWKRGKHEKNQRVNFLRQPSRSNIHKSSQTNQRLDRIRILSFLPLKYQVSQDMPLKIPYPLLLASRKGDPLFTRVFGILLSSSSPKTKHSYDGKKRILKRKAMHLLYDSRSNFAKINDLKDNFRTGVPIRSLRTIQNKKNYAGQEKAVPLQAIPSPPILWTHNKDDRLAWLGVSSSHSHSKKSKDAPAADSLYSDWKFNRMFISALLGRGQIKISVPGTKRVEKSSDIKKSITDFIYLLRQVFTTGCRLVYSLIIQIVYACRNIIQSLVRAVSLSSLYKARHKVKGRQDNVNLSFSERERANSSHPRERDKYEVLSTESIIPKSKKLRVQPIIPEPNNHRRYKIDTKQSGAVNEHRIFVVSKSINGTPLTKFKLKLLKDLNVKLKLNQEDKEGSGSSPSDGNETKSGGSLKIRRHRRYRRDLTKGKFSKGIALVKRQDTMLSAYSQEDSKKRNGEKPPVNSRQKTTGLPEGGAEALQDKLLHLMHLAEGNNQNVVGDTKVGHKQNWSWGDKINKKLFRKLTNNFPAERTKQKWAPLKRHHKMQPTVADRKLLHNIAILTRLVLGEGKGSTKIHQMDKMPYDYNPEKRILMAQSNESKLKSFIPDGSGERKWKKDHRKRLIKRSTELGGMEIGDDFDDDGDEVHGFEETNIINQISFPERWETMKSQLNDLNQHMHKTQTKYTQIQEEIKSLLKKGDYLAKEEEPRFRRKKQNGDNKNEALHAIEGRRKTLLGKIEMEEARRNHLENDFLRAGISKKIEDIKDELSKERDSFDGSQNLDDTDLIADVEDGRLSKSTTQVSSVLGNSSLSVECSADSGKDTINKLMIENDNKVDVMDLEASGTKKDTQSERLNEENDLHEVNRMLDKLLESRAKRSIDSSNLDRFEEDRRALEVEHFMLDTLLQNSVKRSIKSINSDVSQNRRRAPNVDNVLSKGLEKNRRIDRSTLNETELRPFLRNETDNMTVKKTQNTKRGYRYLFTETRSSIRPRQKRKIGKLAEKSERQDYINMQNAINGIIVHLNGALEATKKKQNTLRADSAKRQKEEKQKKAKFVQDMMEAIENEMKWMKATEMQEIQRENKQIRKTKDLRQSRKTEPKREKGN